MKFNRELMDFGPNRSHWLFKVQRQGFGQIFQRLLFGAALTGDVYFKALGDVPTAFFP